MNWTRNRPIESGWFWYREMPNSEPGCKKIFEFEGDLVVINEFMPRGFLKIAMLGGTWWPERIPEPVEKGQMHVE